jgi:two-component system, NtrC family, sensor kinase
LFSPEFCGHDQTGPTASPPRGKGGYNGRVTPVAPEIPRSAARGTRSFLYRALLALAVAGSLGACAATIAVGMGAALWFAVALGAALGLAPGSVILGLAVRGVARARAVEQALARQMAAGRTAELERETEARARAVEERNRELAEALEKLRRAQDDILRHEKLASMGRLVAGIAHEVNNPMNAVLNTLGPLEQVLVRLAASPDGQAAADAAEAQQMLAVVKRGATRTKAIVQALHNYSRGDAETLKDVNLLRSLEDTLDLLRHRLRRIQVVKEIDPAARVTGFAGQIDQVLMNLLTNAVQAIGDGPGTIRVGLHQRGQDVVLSVADDGAGISPEVLPRIFDPFYTTKDVGEGTGLGLSIVHGIVERHGGRVEVESVPGRGTTFRVILPVHAGLVAAVRATSAPP